MHRTANMSRCANRRFKFQKRSQLFIRTHVSARPLQDQTHRELVYRPLQFHERSQHFIGAHNETLPVAMCVHNPDCSRKRFLHALPVTRQVRDLNTPAPVNVCTPDIALSIQSEFRTGVWLKVPAVRESFVPRFPENQSELRKYFTHPTREYFGVYYNDRLVGVVGGENIDLMAGKLEMKKLVGESGLQGKGIGKRATFGFLYYAFMIRNLNKVYIHSRDINMRNINLNSRFGFELEGIFLHDITVGDKYQDVLRMALFKPLWLQIFSRSALAANHF